MSQAQQPKVTIGDEVKSSLEWESSTGPTSNSFPTPSSTVVPNETISTSASFLKRKQIPETEVIKSDGANISLMKREVTPPVTFSEEAKLQRPRNNVFQLWIWEMLSCCIAVGCMVAFAIVLRMYDGKALSEWKHDITINSILSILVTVIKATIVVPLAEGLSQLKWSWFRERERSVQDLVKFDEASRGLWGASRLVVFIRPWHLASIGSVVFLLSIAIGPFAQQALQIDSRVINTTDFSSVPICVTYNSSTIYHDKIITSSLSGKVTKATVGAIYEGLFKYNPLVGSSVSDSVVCPTGNCTFPAYQSLGVCSKCEDVTKYLKYRTCWRKSMSSDLGCMYTKEANGTAQQCKSTGLDRPSGCRYELPNNHQLETPASFSSYTGNTSITPSMAMTPSFLNVTTIQLYGILDTTEVTATECSLYYCVHEYESSSTLGKFEEKSKEVPSTLIPSPGVFSGLTQFITGRYPTISPETCVRNGTRQIPPYGEGDGCAYSMDGSMGYALQSSIKPLIEGIVRYGPSAATTILAGQDSVTSLFEPENKNITVNRAFEGMAAVLTSHIRSYRSYPKICDGFVAGQSYRTEPFMFVVWAWIIYPAVVVAATVLFLVFTMFKTRNEQVWKSSPLALAFSGFHQYSQGQSAHSLGYEEVPQEAGAMEKASKGMKAKLGPAGGWDVRYT